MRDAGIRLSTESGITTARFEKLRIDGPLTYHLGWLFGDLEDDPATQAVVLTGSKNVFLSGADFKALGKMRNREEARSALEMGHAAWAPLREFSKPLVVAINGYCIGGGLELALWGDLRVCVDAVTDRDGRRVPFLGFPEAAMGIVPPLGGVQLLTRLVGPSRAKELLLTGQPITAERALEIGLVDRVVPADAVLDEARELARSILANSAQAVRTVKELVNRSFFVRDLGQALVLEREAFARCCEERDKNERIDAFLASSRAAGLEEAR